MMTHAQHLPRRFGKSIRSRVISGLLIMMPVGFTLFVLVFLYRWTVSPVTRAILWLLGDDSTPISPAVRERLEFWAPLIAIALLVGLVYVVGMIAARVAGKKLIATGESLLLRIPLVKTIYSASKQVVEAVAMPGGKAFKAVVTIEYPRKGIRALGFITGRIVMPDGLEVYKLFVPTSPNITTGFLHFAPADEIQFVNIPIEEAFKMVISGGIIGPGRMAAASSEVCELQADAPGKL